MWFVPTMYGRCSRVVPRCYDGPVPFEDTELQMATAELRRAHVCLILDYDGTLVPIMPSPDLAFPDVELIGLLERLSARQDRMVHIVSGRRHEQIDEWFGSLPIGLHAEHGVWSRVQPDRSWIRAGEPIEPFPPGLLAILREAHGAMPGSLTEVKSSSIALHYRQVARALVTVTVPRVRAQLAALLHQHDFELLDGLEVLEVRRRGVSKANAVQLILEGVSAADQVFAFGDDTTDEDMFKALPSAAVTVRVGPGVSIAKLRVADSAQVRSFLKRLL
jgi:trehalose 6-phosphate synthase/phosphatase